MSALIVIVAVGTAVGLIAAAILYFYPAIIIMLDEREDGQQGLVIGKEAARSSNNGYQQVKVKVNGMVLVTDIAASNEQRTKGLSVKDGLAENEAMLFVFDAEGEQTFWMKDMKFPIDIIWIDSNKTVVHIERNLQPCNFEVLCPTYKPNEDSLYVLETVGGFAERHDISQGTRVEFELNS